MQVAEFHTHLGRTHTDVLRFLSLPAALWGSSSSVVEPSRWGTYAALMHVIITFIS